MDEEPLCEGFDALPEVITRTISNKNLHMVQHTLNNNKSVGGSMYQQLVPKI